MLFTYEAMINPKTPDPYKEDFLLVKAVEALDPYTVPGHATTSRTRARWRRGALTMLPKHLLAVVRGRRAPCASRPRTAARSAPAPTASRSGRAGEKVVLVANPDYYEGRPYLSRIVYRVIPSQATIFLELKAKGVDFASSLTGIQYARQTEYPAFRKAYHKFRYPGERLHLLRLQPQGSALRGPRGCARPSPTRSTSRS